MLCSRAYLRRSILASSAFLVVCSMGCATRISTLSLESTEMSQWATIKQVSDRIAAAYGLASLPEEIFGREVAGEPPAILVAAYSNRNRGLSTLEGGRSHVEIDVFAFPEARRVEITILSYYEEDRTEYVKAIELAFKNALGDAILVPDQNWRSSVVRSVRP